MYFLITTIGLGVNVAPIESFPVSALLAVSATETANKAETGKLKF